MFFLKRLLPTGTSLRGADAFYNGVKPVFGIDPKDFITAERRVGLSEADWGSVWAGIQSDTAGWQRNHHISPADGKPDFVLFAIDPTNAISGLQAAQQKSFAPKKGWGGGQPLYLSLISQTGYARDTHLFAGSSYYPPAMAATIPAVKDYVSTVQRYYGSSVDVSNPFLEGGYAGAALTVEVLKRVGSCLTRDKAIAVANSLSGAIDVRRSATSGAASNTCSKLSSTITVG